MRPQFFRVLTAALAAAVVGSTSSAFADYVPCPVEAAKWGVTGLPDPWDSTVQEGALKEQKGTFINGKEWLLCRYAFPGQDSLFEKSPSQMGSYFHVLSVKRPGFKYNNLSEIKCPGPKLKTRLLTDIPSPWKSTTYVWKQVGKEFTEIAGQTYIRCTYEPTDYDVWGAGPSAILRSLEPDTGPGLAPNPDPKPVMPGNLAAEFAVTQATLDTKPVVEAKCPTRVRFTGSVAANGKGQVHYRIVHNGAEGTPKQLVFGQAGNRPVVAEFQVGGLTGPSVQADSPPAGGEASLAAPSAPNQHTGSARIQILSPQGGVVKSDDANYLVKCVAPKPDGLKARKPAP